MFTATHLTWLVSAPKVACYSFKIRIVTGMHLVDGKNHWWQQFNIMVSFRQLRDVLQKVKDKSKEVGSKQMADRCHEGGREQTEHWLLPPLLAQWQAASGSSCARLSLQRWGQSAPSFGGRRWVTHTKQNTLSEGMNKGPFFFGPSRILSWEPWTKAASSTEATAQGKTFLNDDKYVSGNIKKKNYERKKKNRTS